MPSHLNIHEEAVQSYIRPGGSVHALLDDVARGTYHFSQAYVGAGHIRSGRLLRGLFWNRAKLTGPLSASAKAGSSARHTKYFMEDTRGKVIGHPYMVIPKRRSAHTNPAFSGAGAQKLAEWGRKSPGQKKAGKGVFRATEVRGYGANPFLQEGLAVAMAAQRV